MKRSWMDRFFDWVERLPGSTWAFYLALGAVTFAMGFGFRPVARPDLGGPLLSMQAFVMIAGAHALRTVADRSARRAAPALGLDATGADRLALRLAATPRWIAWAVLVGECYLPIYVLSGAEPLGYREAPWYWLAPGLTSWFFGEMFFWALAAVTIRRIWIISRLADQMPEGSLLHPQPLHALSTITTATAGITLIMLTYVPLLELGVAAITDPDFVAQIAGGAAFAVVVAVAPLWGIHRRLTAERRRLQMTNGLRTQQTLDVVRDAVDRGDEATMTRGDRALGLLERERELLAAASTWPWPKGTVRNLVTTLLVPVVLLVMSRLADRWLG